MPIYQIDSLFDVLTRSIFFIGKGFESLTCEFVCQGSVKTESKDVWNLERALNSQVMRHSLSVNNRDNNYEKTK